MIIKTRARHKSNNKSIQHFGHFIRHKQLHISIESLSSARGVKQEHNAFVYIKVYGIDGTNRFKQQFQQINALYNEIEHSKGLWSLTAVSAHRLRTNQTHFTCHCALFADITKSRWLRGDKGVQPVYVTAASRRRHKRVCKFNTRQIPQNAIQPLCRCGINTILLRNVAYNLRSNHNIFYARVAKKYDCIIKRTLICV